MVPEYPTTSVQGNRDPRWQYSTMTSSAFDDNNHYSLKSTLDIKMEPFKNRKERRVEAAKQKHGKSKHNKAATRRW